MDRDINFWFYFIFNSPFTLAGFLSSHFLVKATCGESLWRVQRFSLGCIWIARGSEAELAGPHPQSVWFSRSEGKAWAFAFLLSSQVMLLLMVWEPYSENHWSSLPVAGWGTLPESWRPGTPRCRCVWTLPPSSAAVAADFFSFPSNKGWRGSALGKGNEVAPRTKWHDQAQTVPFLSWRERECSRLSAWYGVWTCQEFSACGLFSPLMAMSFKEGSLDLPSAGPGVTRGWGFYLGHTYMTHRRVHVTFKGYLKVSLFSHSFSLPCSFLYLAYPLRLCSLYLISLSN